MLEVVSEKEGLKSMPHGESGEDTIGSVTFQVFSWKPRALYFPSFAAAEQCQNIVKMAKSNLKPSTLAWRKGETAERTKGTRTRCASHHRIRLELWIILSKKLQGLQ